MRKLTQEEVISLSYKLPRYRVWSTYCNFAKQCYGPKVHKVVVTGDGEWDDESNTYYRVENFRVYDSSNNELSYDYSQPFFTEYIAKQILQKIEDTLSGKRGTYNRQWYLDNWSRHSDYFTEAGVLRETNDDLIDEFVHDSCSDPRFITWDSFPSSTDYDEVCGEFCMDNNPVDIPDLYVE